MTSLAGTKFDGVGVMHEFCGAWTRAKGAPADLQALIEDPILLADIIKIARGTSEDYVYKIDTDAEPKRPREEAKLLLHRPHGKLRWSDSLVKLVGVLEEYGEAQTRKGVSVARAIEDHGGHSANARIAEFLNLHPGLVPIEWWNFKRIFFLCSRFEVTGWTGEGTTDTVVRVLRNRAGEISRPWMLYMGLISEHLSREDAIAVLDLKK